MRLRRKGRAHAPPFFFRRCFVLNEYFCSTHNYLWLVTIPYLNLGCLSDFATRRIPKISTVPVFLFGVTWHYLEGGSTAALSSIAAAVGYLFYLNFLATLPAMILGPSAMHKMGGGDAKLALACGAVVGMNSLWLMMALHPLVNVLIEGVIFFKDAPDKRPVAVIKSITKEFRAEIYGCGQKVERLFAPYIALPFVLTMVVKQTGGF